ncbi:hypothetical protein NDU88_006481 [Pleurodeles waltl]|uniref:Uncharacterized protein n=1 Tax=Pleurodeles waltl TaxID=8319 RepID=A0AAV7M0B3_PLEWA|nr:hypothetical protein NDU88_006481 [Pleurodeles waltl]
MLSVRKRLYKARHAGLSLVLWRLVAITVASGLRGPPPAPDPGLCRPSVPSTAPPSGVPIRYPQLRPSARLLGEHSLTAQPGPTGLFHQTPHQARAALTRGLHLLSRHTVQYTQRHQARSLPGTFPGSRSCPSLPPAPPYGPCGQSEARPPSPPVLRAPVCATEHTDSRRPQAPRKPLRACAPSPRRPPPAAPLLS